MLHVNAHPRPERVAVIGAGMVGLATAWHLQELGTEVTVFDRADVGSGSSWGNAGWLTPGLATPLPEPSVLTYGVRAVLNPRSPVYVPPRLDPRLWRFLVGFARRSTMRQWQKSMEALIAINDLALDAFDELADRGVTAPTSPASSFVAAYRSASDREPLLQELQHIKSSGQRLEYDLLDGAQARAQEPLLSDEVTAAIQLHGQRFLDPGAYVQSLGDAVRNRGARFELQRIVERVDANSAGVSIDGESYDAAVVAAGAWAGPLLRRFGVRRLVQSGRGYSFSVSCRSTPRGPIYLPSQRVACTPIADRLRVAGMMEFSPPDAKLDPRRIAAIVDAARPFLDGADVDDRIDEWVGPRPCTVDGLPLIGATASPHVFVAGGHGMWGITLGPISGRLLAKQIITGSHGPELEAFSPLR
ncbi:FAD-dependent oxidoreductase [Nocardioides sp.]|uniref:NAD(P)/FAD-dependent oxidoreductase n=1 Tax=Nocardioides sp. TaxID=35761 RepID=UPI00260CE221|nr:FAD-dependent oxidoreductase [Nocardioides sp.]MDI6908573.1 FAD-dependent oxidoreductase [Nocardioides sp.]